MVTARTEDSDKIRGLGIGADDYISEEALRVMKHAASGKGFKENRRLWQKAT
jgi:hypothetical protein